MGTPEEPAAAQVSHGEAVLVLFKQPGFGTLNCMSGPGGMNACVASPVQQVRHSTLLGALCGPIAVAAQQCPCWPVLAAAALQGPPQ
jgi:hypothetical protein